MGSVTTTPGSERPEPSTYVQVMTEGIKIEVPPELMRQMMQNVLTGAMSDAMRRKTSHSFLGESIEKAVDKLFSNEGFGRNGNSAGRMIENALERSVDGIVWEMIDGNDQFKAFVRETFDEILNSDEMRAKLRDRLAEKALKQI